MDLSSMLNNDDSKPAGPSVPVVIRDRLPSTQATSPPGTTSQIVQTRDNAPDDSYLPRKRQKIEDSPSPSSAALSSSSKPSLPPASQPNTENPLRRSSGAGVSPQQAMRPQPTQSPISVSRNNSIIAVGDLPDGFEPSIINVHPSEELTRVISDFIFLNLNEEGLETLEVS